MGLNLDRLNKEQKEAVIYGDGPLLIVAGAGTGKTTVITQRIAYLIEKEKVELVKEKEDLYRIPLKKAGLLTRDSRIRERRKVGTGGKARRKKQSPKR